MRYYDRTSQSIILFQPEMNPLHDDGPFFRAGREFVMKEEKLPHIAAVGREGDFVNIAQLWSAFRERERGNGF